MMIPEGRVLARTTVAVLLLVLLAATPVLAQRTLLDYKGDENYNHGNIHSGNKVETLFYNYGLVGNTESPSGVWPLGTGNEYIGDVSPLVAVEYIHPSGRTVNTVIACIGPRSGGYDRNPDGTFAGFAPLPGFDDLKAGDQPTLVAMSNQPETWPPFWPDKMHNDPRDQLWARDEVDPGWREAWNGYFGKNVFSADQESYFIMDDNQDREFQTLPLLNSAGNDSLDENGDPVLVTYYPMSADSSRGGIGIRVAVRGFQWSHFLAEDVIFWHYEIANISDYDYSKVGFGMIVGTLSGGRDDSNDDLASFDPEDDITYSWDDDDVGSPGWVPIRPGIRNVGYVGYAFLESPGNAYDGIDNDGDGEAGTGPVFSAQQLQALVETGISYSAGDQVVTIDYELFSDPGFYENITRGRRVVSLPDTGYVTTIYGNEVRINPGQGYREIVGNGIDDNWNGLIDEIYSIPNESGKRLDHVGRKYVDFVTGEGLDNMMIDEARDDGVDNDGDWEALTDDVGFDGQAGTGDSGEGNGVPDNGEPHFDKTDINESDQIGLTSFNYFLAGAVRLNDDNGTGGASPTGTGGVWGLLQPGVVDLVSQEPEDGDFAYGSGYFPLPSGKTERFSMALIYGEDFDDIQNNKRTVQQIYDNNYTFVKPPPKPTVRAVPGDGQVTLYWDREAESAFDESMPEGYQQDFEGYKIYRATDPGFLENFVITDGQGRRVFHRPIAQFDLEDGVEGYFPEAALGVSFYLGEDTGLQHVWTDTTVQNGQTYYYAVTAYDFGFSGMVDGEPATFFPAETPKVITIDSDGSLRFDINTVSVVPGVQAAGYQEPVLGMARHTAGGASGVVYQEIVDPRMVPDGVNYRISFGGEGQVADTVYIHDDATDQLLYVQTLDDAVTNRKVLDEFDAYYQQRYDDEFFETWTRFDVVEGEVFEGHRLYFVKPRESYAGNLIPNASGWSSTRGVEDSLLTFRFGIFSQSGYPTGERIYGDYEITFTDELDYEAEGITIESTSGGGDITLPPRAVNFRVMNTVTGERAPFAFAEASATVNGRINHNDQILMLKEVELEDGSLDTLPSWRILFRNSADSVQITLPERGDTLRLSLYKPFTPEDVFGYSSEAARVEQEEVELSRIKVYPNPYLATSSQEPKGLVDAGGRGERRINFIHLPDRCTIRIFNVRGELVDRIEHRSSIFDGSATWDLRSKDDLDVAYGIYLFHVESPYGEHTGKFALIK